MIQKHVVIGFFDDETEARQAVQQLLAEGSDPDHIKLATQTDPDPVDGDQPAAPDPSSGRFLTSLFGSDDADLLNPEAVQRGTILITVQTQSPPEAEQVAGLLGTAGATDVTVDGATAEL